MSSKAVALLLGLVVPALAGCTTMKTDKVTPARYIPTQGTLIGITKVDGQEVRFDQGARVRSDTVLAVVGGAATSYPLTEVSRLWVYRRDGTREAMKGFGIVGGMLAIGLIVGQILKETT